MINPQLFSFKIIDTFTSFHNQYPLLLWPNNSLLVGNSRLNFSTQKRYIEIRNYDFSFNFYGCRNFVIDSDIAANTILNNTFNEMTFGGIIYINKTSRFWVAHFNSSGNLFRNYTEGENNSQVISASYIHDHLQIYVGIANEKSSTIGYKKYHTGSLIIMTITDNGRFVSRIGSGYLGNCIYLSMTRFNRTGVHIYDNLNQKSIYRIQIISQINCPPKANLIKEIENGCFNECIPYTFHNNSAQCNSDLSFGCNIHGRFIENFTCNSKVKVDQYEYTENINIISAKLISKNQIHIKINATVKSLYTKLPFIIKKDFLKNISHNTAIINFVQPYDNFYFNLTVPSEINCVDTFTIVLTKMIIYSIKDYSVPSNTIIPISNFEDIPCNISKSVQSSQTLTYTSMLLDKVSGVAVGSNLISFNPAGIIMLMNCVNELSSIQFFNFGKKFPYNLNKFFNLTSMFNFGFFANPLSYAINISEISPNKFLENNIGYHNAFNGTLFLYNMMQIFSFNLPFICHYFCFLTSHK